VVARVAEPPFRCWGRFSSRITREHLEAAPAPSLGHSDRGPLGANRDLRRDRLSIVLAVLATLRHVEFLSSARGQPANAPDGRAVFIVRPFGQNWQNISRNLELHCAVDGGAELLTKHARALVCIAHDPGVRLRDIAATLGITERSAYTIVTDLTAAGYVVKNRDGRRSRYQVQSHLPLREASTRERTIGDVLDVLVESELPVGEHPSPR
jgi:hypothetical protein